MSAQRQRTLWVLEALCAITAPIFFTCLIAVCSVHAQDTPSDEGQVNKDAKPAADDIRQLKARIERLEQQNQKQNSQDIPIPSRSWPDALIPEAATDTVTSKPKLTAEWDNGLQLSSPDKAFRVHVGGTLQVDTGWNAAAQAVETGPGGIGELQDGGLLRRARIRIDGTMYEHIEWVAEYDFANTVENDTSTTTQTIGSPSFVNAWVGMNDIPLVGTVRAGWMKEPISFEFQKSGRWLNFMERTPGMNSFFTRSVGLMALNQTESEQLTWAFGVFHVEDDNFGFGFGNGEYAEVGRLTWLPWYENDGERLLHLGIGARHGHLDQNQIDMKGRPSVRTMPGSAEPPLADTGTIDGNNQDTIDTELAAVCRPWTLQSEYYCTFLHNTMVNNQPLGTLFYQGTYVELLYFLSGEYQPYDLKGATFGRVIPLRNFSFWDEPGGWGAWQLGIRYGFLDLQDKGVNGATLNDIVLGLNWFLNPNAKVQWNLAIDHRQSTPAGSSGWTYIFGTRVALDF